MENKSIIIIILSIIIVILAGSLFINNFHSNTFNVDEVSFKILDNYNLSEENDVFILNNSENSIFINKNTSTNINKTINDYIKHKEKENCTVQISTKNIDDIKIYKASVNDKPIVHYWFEKNDKVYEIYSWNSNQDTDSVVSELIKSTNSIF